jgi:hypothetical protein
MKLYARQLLDPRWQQKRLKILQRDSWKCLECGVADKTLHVHHLYYCKGRAPWEYPDWALETRCEDCHDGQTAHDEKGEFILTDWERTIEWLSKGTSDFGNSGLYELAVHLFQSEGDYRELMGDLLTVALSRYNDDNQNQAG